jgi:hypothetical protein
MLRPTEGRRSPRRGRSAGTILALVVLAATSCSRPPPTPQGPSIDFRGDFETADARQFGALECPHPSRQFTIVTHPVRQGLYGARFEVAPGDTWTNGSVRCLVAAYGSDESEGDDYYFAFSMLFPTPPSENLVWELHNRQDMYSVSPNTAVAPHAVVVSDGSLRYRLLTGPAFWNGSEWTGWSHYEPDIPILDKVPAGRWIDLVVHVRFTRSDNGILEIWSRTEGENWPSAPQVSRRSVPTLQWIPGTDNRVFGHLNDRRVPSDVYTTSLYVELGLYPGADSIDRASVVFLDGYRRARSLNAVMSEFPRL